MFFINPGKFPIHCVPYSIRQVILIIHAQVKAPLEIVVASVLAVLATATQHLVKVRRPTGQISPISLALMTFAISGDRKSSSDNAAFGALKAFDQAQTDLHKKSLIGHKAALMVWKAQCDGIASQIRKAAAHDESTDALAAQLHELHDKKPIRPKQTRLVYANATPQALSAGLHNNSQSAALISNDASGLLFGPTMSNLSMLCELWSGDRVIVDRVSKESFSLDNHLLSTSLMVQPKEFHRYLKTRGAHMRSSGYLARCLTSCPASIQGFREIFPDEFIPTAEIDIFHQRITELLSTNNTQPTGNLISFDSDAAAAWRKFFNDTEIAQRQGQIYDDIGDFASKIAENASRIAAIFSCYDGKMDSINLEYTQQATEISMWYLAQFKLLFGSEYQVSLEEQDAQLLEQWMMRHTPHKDGFIYVEKSYILQRGPNRLRSRERLNNALQQLAQLGRVAEFLDGKKRYIQFVPTPAPPMPSVAPLSWPPYTSR